MSDLLSVPGLEIAPIRISVPIARALMRFLENPHLRCGLVEVASNRQVAMTLSSQAMLPSNLDVERAVQLRREDYFAARCINDFDRQWPSQLEPNNPNSFFEYTWTAINPQGEEWSEFTNRYQLITDPWGNEFHVCENLDFSEISKFIEV